MTASIPRATARRCGRNFCQRLPVECVSQSGGFLCGFQRPFGQSWQLRHAAPRARHLPTIQWDFTLAQGSANRRSGAMTPVMDIPATSTITNSHGKGSSESARSPLWAWRPPISISANPTGTAAMTSTYRAAILTRRRPRCSQPRPARSPPRRSTLRSRRRAAQASAGAAIFGPPRIRPTRWRPAGR